MVAAMAGQSRGGGFTSVASADVRSSVDERAQRGVEALGEHGAAVFASDPFSARVTHGAERIGRPLGEAEDGVGKGSRRRIGCLFAGAGIAEHACYFAGDVADDGQSRGEVVEELVGA